MSKTPSIVATSAVILILASYLALAQQPAPQNAAQQHPMTFFITSVGMGKGGDLGGLAGADPPRIVFLSFFSPSIEKQSEAVLPLSLDRLVKLAGLLKGSSPTSDFSLNSPNWVKSAILRF